MLLYLGNAVVLQVDDSRHRHLDAAKDSNHLQLLVIKRGGPKVLQGNSKALWFPQAPQLSVTQTTSICLLPVPDSLKPEGITGVHFSGLTGRYTLVIPVLSPVTWVRLKP